MPSGRAGARVVCRVYAPAARRPRPGTPGARPGEWGSMHISLHLFIAFASTERAPLIVLPHGLSRTRTHTRKQRHARTARAVSCLSTHAPSAEHGPWAWPIPERESMKPYVSRSLQLKDLDAVIRFELRSAGRVVDDNVKGFVHVKQSFERIHRL